MTTEHLLLKALRREKVSRPPVWMMRQAGRYLPEYIELRKKYDFFTRVQTPELVCEITLQPIRRLTPDAAIIFSDILVIPQALGVEVQMVESKGPYLPQTINTPDDVNKLNTEYAADSLGYVYEAIRLTKHELNNQVPLIGFTGAPFTILCYMVEGKGSKTFDKAKQFCFTKPQAAHQLLQKITTVTIQHLKKQVEAGADVVQVFDSWSGLLSPADFNVFCLPYLNAMVNEIAPLAPVILFPKGSAYALPELGNTKASAIGLDWCITPQKARTLTQNKITLQGNFDPSKLFLKSDEIKKEVTRMINDFGVQNYIVNLGHGILPTVPVENAQAFIDAVKNYKS